MPLSKAQRKLLNVASPAAIEALFLNGNGHRAASRWISATNRYLNDPVDALRADKKQGFAINAADLRDYIAAAGPLHTVDAWSYLGRAIDAAGRADIDTARHLAYYAELRAALAILACQGIGIFAEDHFVIDRNLGVQRLGGTLGTHQIAWLALNHWAATPSASDLVGNVVQVRATPIRDWLRCFMSGQTAHLVAEHWLRSWGLDLARLSDDRTSRNRVSYQPCRMAPPAGVNAPRYTAYVGAFWRECEPSASNRFARMDLHLLRLSLEAVFKATDRGGRGTKASRFVQRVEGMLSQLPAGSDVIRDFILRTSEPSDPPVIEQALRRDPVTAADHYMQVLSRALLLSRIATGAVARLFQKTGCTNGDVAFFWRSVGEERGILKPGEVIQDLADLWAEVDFHVELVLEWSANTPQGTMADWRRYSAESICTLGECERIGLWGMGL